MSSRKARKAANHDVHIPWTGQCDDLGDEQQWTVGYYFQSVGLHVTLTGLDKILGNGPCPCIVLVYTSREQVLVTYRRISHQTSEVGQAINYCVQRAEV